MNRNDDSAPALFPATPGLATKPTYRDLPFGFEEPMDESRLQVLELVRRFADEVLRPCGAALDRMTPEEVIAPGSMLWTARERYAALGLSEVDSMGLCAGELCDLKFMISEELGRGDSGLACSVVAGSSARRTATRWGRPDLLEVFTESMVGCWAITEPAAGSDMLDWDRLAAHPQGSYERPSLIATLKGDKVVLNGQKAAWVGFGPIADYALLCTTFDRGQGREGIAIFTPLNLPGVSRGKPLDKMGMRAEPQGEIFFDNVEVPVRFIAAGPDRYADAVYDLHCEGGTFMGPLFVGVARAAYEHAWAYAHERKQGGAPIIRHQSVRQRLFHMLRKIEAARALARRVARYNVLSGSKALHASIASKITATQTAFEVASDALQIFGGNGTARAYPLEKLLRDARISLIADGCNEMMAVEGGSLLTDPERL